MSVMIPPNGSRMYLLIVLAVCTFVFAPVSDAAEFSCPSGNVRCLINAIDAANDNLEPSNTINLGPGAYTLTTPFINRPSVEADGPSGLPSISSTLTIRGSNTTIRSNGRFRIFHVGSAGTLTLEGVTVRDGVIFAPNLPDDFPAGSGILNRGTLTLVRSSVINNRALGAFVGRGAGAGIANVGGEVTLLNSTLADNFTEAFGGGLANSGTAVFLNTTVARNRTAGFSGGGIFNNAGGTVFLLNSTVADNSAGGARNSAGGLGNAPTGTVTLQNTLLAGNAGVAPDCTGQVTSLGNNLIGDPTGCTITLLSTDLTGNPGLSDFTDNGTPGNGHFPLLADSRAIGAANDAACPDLDQVGQLRVLPCDIGAIQFPHPALSVSQTSVPAGGMLLATWSGITPPTPTDWIGLFAPSTGDIAFIDWIYVSCSKTPRTPRPSGVCTFIVPASVAPGDYELRLLANDGFTRLATSNIFRITQ